MLYTQIVKRKYLTKVKVKTVDHAKKLYVELLVQESFMYDSVNLLPKDLDDTIAHYSSRCLSLFAGKPVDVKY